MFDRSKPYSPFILAFLQFISKLRLLVCSTESLYTVKDVRANCSCASLLRTQLMSQRHATSKEEIYSPEGIVTVALTLLRINSLGWSVTPTFFYIDDFLY